MRKALICRIVAVIILLYPMISAAADIVIRRSDDGRWFSYSIIGTEVSTKGRLDVSRNFSYQLVAREDFDGDGSVDLLLRDVTGSENGRWVLYTLQSQTITSRGPVDLTRNADWVLEASADFDGDARSDLLLRHRVSGKWLLYLLDGHTIKAQGQLPLTPLLTDRVLGTGDFDGDGNFDVLTRSVNGSWKLFLFDGLNDPTGLNLPFIESGDQEMQAIADFNGDGMSDVLTRDLSGRWTVYLMNGGDLIESGSPDMTRNLAFQLVTASDFSGDGKTDLLLRRSDGRWFIYIMDGTSVVSGGNPDLTENLDFALVAAEDFNSDGKTDLLMRRSDGRWIVYLMDGSQVLASGPPDMTRNLAWQPVETIEGPVVISPSHPTSNEAVSVPFILKAPLNVGPVFAGGTFNGWNDSNPDFELIDTDGDGEWTVIATIDQGIHDFGYYQGFRQWIRDPNIMEHEIGDPLGTRLTVTDPMIVYLLPLTGTEGLRPGEPIRALFGYSELYPIDPSSIEVLINGVAVQNADSYYDPNSKEFSYTPSELLEPGSYTIQVSAASEVGSITRSVTFDRAPAFELLTQDITYRRPNIVAYGLLNDPGLTGILATLNSAPVNTQITGNQFQIPIELTNGDNTFEISATDSFGNVAKSSQILHAEFDLRPTGEIQGSVAGGNVSLAVVATAIDGGAISFEWVADSSNPEPLQFAQLVGSQNSFPIPSIDGEYFFNVIITDSSLNQYTARRFLTVDQGAATLNGINDHAAWIEDMILYEMMPELASPERDLKGAQARLIDIADLGVNTIWLTPIFATDWQCTLGYGTTNYYDVCTAKGNTLNDFKNFVDAAHALGLRVILDLALDHVGYRHPFFQNVLDLKENSPFVDFFIWDGAPGNSDYEHEPFWWEWPFLNMDDAESIDYFIDVAEYWLEQYDLDGYRLDVAGSIDERSPQFWPEFRRRIKNIRPESFLLSEGVPPTVELYEGRFDSNFDFDLRGWGFEDQNSLISLLNGQGSIDEVHNVLTRQWPSHARPMRFVEQHDHGRMPALYDLDRSLLAHTLISTVPGIPMFFTGGEFGHEANQYDFDQVLDWGDSKLTKPYFKRLMDIRKSYLRSDAALSRISNSLPATVYSYKTDSTKGSIITLLNFGSSSASGTIDVSSESIAGIDSYLIRNLLTDDQEIVDESGLNNFGFSLNGYAATIITISPDPP